MSIDDTAGDWTVYILQCADGTYYTGITNNMTLRLQKHNDGSGARYTKGRGPVRLVHEEQAAGRSAASRREAEIKALSRMEKIALIQP